MPEIIFSRTRHEYDSYSDFWRIVELSGYQIVFYDEIDWKSDNLYIHCPMNGNYREHVAGIKDRKCTVAHWLLERPDTGLLSYIAPNRELVTSRLVDFNIVSDTALAKATGFHYVPLGSHAGLGQMGKSKQYDFCGLMSYTGRRAFLFRNPQTVRPRVGSFSMAPNCWGHTRDLVLQSSRFGINVHKDRFTFGEPIRFAIFAAYGLPFFTETICDEHIYGDAVVSVPLSSLFQTMDVVMSDYPRWAQRGVELRERLTGELCFRKCIERWL